MEKAHKKEQWNILIIFTDKEDIKVTSCISTSHMLARELLSKPDGFITATYGNEELVIEDFSRISTHANIDDSVMHWTLNLRDGGKGNIKR